MKKKKNMQKFPVIHCHIQAAGDHREVSHRKLSPYKTSDSLTMEDGAAPSLVTKDSYGSRETRLWVQADQI